MARHPIVLALIVFTLLGVGLSFSISIADDRPKNPGVHQAEFEKGNPCPPDDLPCIPLPTPNATYRPIDPARVNGVEIPVPEGATVGVGIMDPGGTLYIYSTVDSRISFLANGWLMNNSVTGEEEAKFASSLERLHSIADPLQIGDKVIPVPLGAVIKPAISDSALGFAGPAGLAPNLIAIDLGESRLSFDLTGRVVVDEVKASDEASFGSVRQALGEVAAD